MADGYLKRRRNYRDISGSQVVAAATDDTTLQAGRTNFTIYIQRLIVTVSAGSSGKTWTFKDSAGTPVLVTPAIDVSTGGSYVYDFGADGVALTEAKDFALDVSAAGAAGHVTWEGYMKLTAVINLNSTANTVS